MNRSTGRRAVAALVAVGVAGLLLWSGLRRPIPEPGGGRDVATDTDPLAGAEARVRALLDAARAGDVDAYLASFAGPLRARLDREVAERGRKPFADELRHASRTRKGRSVFAPVPDGPEAARVVVEMVYPDRNERQTFLVEQTDRGGWVVADVEIVRTHRPQAAFGDLATFGGPEGVPVPVADRGTGPGDD